MTMHTYNKRAMRAFFVYGVLALVGAVLWGWYVRTVLEALVLAVIGVGAVTCTLLAWVEVHRGGARWRHYR